MKKIININLSGRLIPIEDSAYDLLKGYLDSLKKYFAREEGRDEIVSDIENRIAEIFQDKLKKGAHCITDEEVNAVIASMGRPEQFDDEPSSAKESTSSLFSDSPFIRPKKRLYRDSDDKILGGVCSGLGAYFAIDPIVFRLVFALLLFGAGTGILVYIILWIATPEARSTAEKLEMRGERVDLQNITNTVKEEMTSLKSRMEGFGEDVKNFSLGRGRQIGNDLGDFLRDVIQGLAKALVLIFKALFIFLAVIILISLVGAAIVLAGSSAALFPLKNILLDGFWQNFLFWPAILLLIGIPIVALVIFIIRKLAGVKYTSRYIGYSLSFLWIVGVACTILLVISMVKDFRMSYRESINYPISQPANGRLVIMPMENHVYFDGMNWFDDALNVTDDTVIIKNVALRIEKSPNDSFAVKITKISNGNSVAKASWQAQNIYLPISQNDSILYINPGFSLTNNNKFRNQRVIVSIFVPINKSIRVDQSMPSFMRWTRWDWNYNDDYDYNNNSWDNGINYRMTPGGLLPTDTSKVSPEDNASRNSTHPINSAPQKKEIYHYHGTSVDNGDNNNGDSVSPAKENISLDGISILFYELFNLGKNN